MPRSKPIREKGKFSFTRFFQKFKPGDTIALVRNLGFPLDYPKGMQGRTGKVIGQRGAAYYVEISDLGKLKRYLIKPIHLRRIEESK